VCGSVLQCVAVCVAVCWPSFFISCVHPHHLLAVGVAVGVAAVGAVAVGVESAVDCATRVMEWLLLSSLQYVVMCV